uniref:Bifunctional inhibitor/plant lipid transfer protein/seed storage helical domain-containing protein n=1 Tax=Setaria digitata TaxID=48799 RepID=A0A915PWZ8_9BILA
MWIGISHQQETMRQCTCSEIDPCQRAGAQAISPCADQCEKFASAIGGSFQQIRACFRQRQPIIDRTLKCVQDSFSNACARGPPKTLPRRYTKTIEIAAMNEVNKELRRMGIADQMTNLLSQGRRCVLDLPSDNVVVQTIRSCALRSGVTTKPLQELCRCIENAGVRQLATICPRIQIS